MRWSGYLVIPIISNMLENHTESVLFKNRRTFPWEQLIGNSLDFAAALVFVYFANRWIYSLGRPRRHEPAPDAEATSTPGTDKTVAPPPAQGESELAQ